MKRSLYVVLVLVLLLTASCFVLPKCDTPEFEVMGDLVRVTCSTKNAEMFYRQGWNGDVPPDPTSSDYKVSTIILLLRLPDWERQPDSGTLKVIAKKRGHRDSDVATITIYRQKQALE